MQDFAASYKSFKKGDRIAQLVIQRVEEAQFVEVMQLPGSERAEGGFGSTGISSSSPV
jgi:dUTP pyrophosphatase